MSKLLNPTIAEINLSHLVSNLGEIRKLLPPKGKVLCVVKADAYGHGAVAISKCLQNNGIELFGVATMKEAEELREAGILKQILVFGGISESETEAALQYDISPVIFTRESAISLNDAAVRLKKNISVHLEIDTGMGRLGTSSEDAPSFVSFIKTLSNLKLTGIMTHFAEAESDDHSYTEQQLALFRGILEKTLPETKDITPHAANSAALIQHTGALYPLCRIGLMLYGYQPLKKNNCTIHLKPLMSLKTRVIFLKTVSKGASISYGRTFTATREMNIATLACGYADGINRKLSNNGNVIIRGEKAPIVGRVCMDQTMVDVSHISRVKIGDEAVLIGEQEGEAITADEIAQKIGTISYEVLCGIGKRVDRIYRN